MESGYSSFRARLQQSCDGNSITSRNATGQPSRKLELLSLSLSLARSALPLKSRPALDRMGGQRGQGREGRGGDPPKRVDG